MDLLSSNQTKQVPAEDFIEVVVEKEEKASRYAECHDNSLVHFFSHSCQAENDEHCDPGDEEEDESEDAELVAAFYTACVQDGKENRGNAY